MDYLKYAFSLQLTDSTDLIVVRAIEMSLRCCKEPDGIDRMLAKFDKDFASRSDSYQKPWFISLINAIRPYYIKELDSDTGEPVSDCYENAFNNFIEAMLTKLNGGRSLFMLMGRPVNFDLHNFTQDELAQPHMQWVTLFVSRHNALRAAFPHVKNVIAMACIHPSHQIADSMLLTLKESYHAEEFDIVMSYVEYVNWYLKSRGHFETESVKLDGEYGARMERTLEAWHTSSPDQALETHVDWLCRNYEFHPQHREFVTAWAKAHLDTFTQTPATA